MSCSLKKEDIRIGTLVGAGMKAPAYIEQIIDHGFEQGPRDR